MAGRSSLTWCELHSGQAIIVNVSDSRTSNDVDATRILSPTSQLDTSSTSSIIGISPLVDDEYETCCLANFINVSVGHSFKGSQRVESNQSGRSAEVKVDGPRGFKLTV